MEYKPRSAIKGHDIADFLLEFPETFHVESNECLAEPPSKEVVEENWSPWWTLNVDGAVNEWG